MSPYAPGLRADTSAPESKQSELAAPALIADRRSKSANISETAKLLLAGGVAGALSKSATAPLARLTILYQVRVCQMQYTTLWLRICLLFLSLTQR